MTLHRVSLPCVLLLGLIPQVVGQLLGTVVPTKSAVASPIPAIPEPAPPPAGYPPEVVFDQFAATASLIRDAESRANDKSTIRRIQREIPRLRSSISSLLDLPKTELGRSSSGELTDLRSAWRDTVSQVIGDRVTVRGVTGVVTNIGIRSSAIHTWEEADVIVPNGDLIQHDLTNWTLTSARRRGDVMAGTAYGSDPDTVIRLLCSLATTHPEVDAFHIKIHRVLTEAGIENPFPQRDVHSRTSATISGT